MTITSVDTFNAGFNVSTTVTLRILKFLYRVFGNCNLIICTRSESHRIVKSSVVNGRNFTSENHSYKRRESDKRNHYNITISPVSPKY